MADLEEAAVAIRLALCLKQESLWRLLLLPGRSARSSALLRVSLITRQSQRRVERGDLPRQLIGSVEHLHPRVVLGPREKGGLLVRPR
jgi:hypothetical protein